MAHRLLLHLILWVAFAASANAAQTGLVCMAPTDPTEAGRPIAGIDAIEFYLDGGNPLTAYAVPFKLLSAKRDPHGHTVNIYAVSGATTEAARVVFAENTPLTFNLAEIGRTLNTLGVDNEETAFMASAVPGIACWNVEALPPS